MRLLGEDDAGGIGPYVAGDARQRTNSRFRMQVDIEFGRAQHLGLIGGQRERSATERRRVDAEKQVVHDRVGDHGHVENFVELNPGRLGRTFGELIEGLAHRFSHRDIATLVHHHVGNTTH